jgi:glutamine amidotransferase-like uncharacterized protein
MIFEEIKSALKWACGCSSKMQPMPSEELFNLMAGIIFKNLSAEGKNNVELQTRINELEDINHVLVTKCAIMCDKADDAVVVLKNQIIEWRKAFEHVIELDKEYHSDIAGFVKALLKNYPQEI